MDLRIEIVAVIFFLLSSCSNKTSSKGEPTIIQKGEYLVTIGGCNDCHSPKVLTDKGPVPDPERLLSGHPASEILPAFDTTTAKSWLLFTFSSTAAHGPWGTSFAANITPDSTGIGSWTEEQFLNAMQKGYYHGIEGSRSILPPMPWNTYAKMEKEDILAIFAYLKSIKPVSNIVPAYIPPGSK